MLTGFDELLNEAGFQPVKAAPGRSDLHAGVDAGSAQKVAVGGHCELVGEQDRFHRGMADELLDLGPPRLRAEGPRQHLKTVLGGCDAERQIGLP